MIVDVVDYRSILGYVFLDHRLRVFCTRILVTAASPTADLILHHLYHTVLRINELLETFNELRGV